MKKRILMLLAVAFLLVGCGHQQETNNPNTDQPTTTESTTTTEPTSTPTEAPTTTEEPTEPPHEHTYTESTTKEATCSEAGEKTFTCDCGDTYAEQIEATGHNYEAVTDSEVSATCTNDGKEADTKCSLCDDVISGVVIPATGHNYETVANSSAEPTCTKDGKKEDTKCSLCGDIITGAVIPALSHSYGDYVYNNDATTEKDGTETATCSTCGDKTTRTKAGTKLEPETHWYDGYARGVWHDMGEYMFWIGNTMDEVNDMARNINGTEALDKAAILCERYPDRKAYVAAGLQGGVPTAFVSTNIDNPFWRPTFIWE